MKKLLIALMCIAAIAAPAAAQDVREAVKKAEADRVAAEARAREVEAGILADKAALQAKVEELEAREKKLETDINSLRKEKADKQVKHDALQEKWSARDSDFHELSGNVRMAARDVEAMLEASPATALNDEPLKKISPLLDAGHFPDINDIGSMVAVLFNEMARSSQVTLQKGTFVGRDGEDHEGDILLLGRFTALYHDKGEVGFLNYTADSRKLGALSVLPSGSMQRAMKRYFEGKGETVPIDIAGGESLSQLTHHRSLIEEFQLGGNIMWPILIVALTVIFFTLYKSVYLKRVHGDTDKIMGVVNDLAEKGDWDSVDQIMKTHKNHNWPVVNVLRDGIAARHEDRETMENVLQESILREIPRLEKGLSIMAALGAISPLLGLLGTVTGMIRTFNVITVYGTGDPKLMSGGISEALIATKWGLCIAVPTMLLHVFLSRRANAVVSDMEEKAVGLTNVIQKEQRRGNLAVSA
ncbi:MAG TPA: MotA/TolQ/ExbB proton channel family protein [Candidatus Krumholzibacteria bacterium]|nr:MotA/TolQ/ExbB proton channel family protein [Candidatus Krumholzibacteria bacterium]